jgi:hypothetical protein
MEGSLVKRGRRFKTWRRRWFVLRGNVLAYFRNQSSFLSEEVPFGQLTISSVEDYPPKRYCFEILSVTDRILYIYAENESEYMKYAFSLFCLSYFIVGRWKHSLGKIMSRVNRLAVIGVGTIELGAKIAAGSSGQVLQAKYSGTTGFVSKF